MCLQQNIGYQIILLLIPLQKQVTSYNDKAENMFTVKRFSENNQKIYLIKRCVFDLYNSYPSQSVSNFLKT